MIRLPKVDNLTLYQGDPWSDSFVLVDPRTGEARDLSGYSAEAPIRERPSSPGVLATMEVVLEAGSVKGLVQRSLTGEQTESLTLLSVHALRLTKSGDPSADFTAVAGEIRTIRSPIRRRT